MCSTLAVKLKVTFGCSACSARAMRSACVGPLRKSGSPKSMWRAPVAICARASSSTTSAGTAKKRPPYTGGIGQCRHRCLQPRVASTWPATRCSPAIASRAYFASAGSARAIGHQRGAAAGRARFDGDRGARGDRRRQLDELGLAIGAEHAVAPPRRAAPGSASRRGRRSRGARCGFARRTYAPTRRPSISAVCIGTEIATKRAAARRARAASSSGSTARSRHVGWKPAARRWATADATPSGW